jgi:hypothetical protein
VSKVKAVLPWKKLTKQFWYRENALIPFDNLNQNEVAFLQKEIDAGIEEWHWLITIDSVEYDGRSRRYRNARIDCDAKLTELGFKFLSEKFRNIR